MLPETRLQNRQDGTGEREILVQKTYQCRNCRKILEKSKRKPEDHRCGEWKCKNSTNTCAISINLSRKPRRIIENLSSTTSKRHKTKWYRVPRGIRQQDSRAKKCTADCSICNKCRICSNCRQSWCGLEEHKVNYAVLSPPASNAWRNRRHRIPNARFVVVVAPDVGSWKRMLWSQRAITDADTDRGYSEVEALSYNSAIT